MFGRHVIFKVDNKLVAIKKWPIDLASMHFMVFDPLGVLSLNRHDALLSLANVRHGHHLNTHNIGTLKFIDCFLVLSLLAQGNELFPNFFGIHDISLFWDNPKYEWKFSGRHHPFSFPISWGILTTPADVLLALPLLGTVHALISILYRFRSDGIPQLRGSQALVRRHFHPTLHTHTWYGIVCPCFNFFMWWSF